MNRTFARRIGAAVAGPAMAATILLTGLTAGIAPQAAAQPASGQQCSSMAMPNPSAAGSQNPLTRSAQVQAATGSTASDGSMPVDCQAVGHS